MLCSIHFIKFINSFILKFTFLCELKKTANKTLKETYSIIILKHSFIQLLLINIYLTNPNELNINKDL